jgi:sugar phosphate isomerase/epimerase
MRDFSADLSALALNTATLGGNVEGAGQGWPLERVIDACAERGFGAMVYWRRELGERAAAIGERTREAGLSVAGLCRTPFLTGPYAPPLSVLRDDFCSAIDMAAALGAPVLTSVVGGVIPGGRGLEASLGLVAEIIADVAPHAAASGVRIALEPLHPVYAGDRSCIVTVRDALELCATIDHPAVGIAVDVYHVWWDRTLAAELTRAGAGRILGYHLCDWLAETRDVLLDRGMMGDGVANLRAIRRAVEDAGYDGFCEVEIFSAATWWRQDPGKVLDVVAERFRTVC